MSCDDTVRVLLSSTPQYGKYIGKIVTRINGEPAAKYAARAAAAIDDVGSLFTDHRANLKESLLEIVAHESELRVGVARNDDRDTLLRAG